VLVTHSRRRGGIAALCNADKVIKVSHDDTSHFAGTTTERRKMAEKDES